MTYKIDVSAYLSTWYVYFMSCWSVNSALKSVKLSLDNENSFICVSISFNLEVHTIPPWYFYFQDYSSA
jgi:hypothetical protein